MKIDTWTTVQKVMEDTGRSARELSQLSMSEWARLTNRSTPSQVAVQAGGYEEPMPPAHDTVPAPEAVQANAHALQGVDVSQLSMADYSRLRHQLGVAGREYGRGALDGGSTADWIAAAQRKAGRAAMQSGNVQEAAQIGSRFLNEAQPVQGRQDFYR